MVSVDQLDTDLRSLPSRVPRMSYQDIYDILFSVPNSEIPITASFLLGALSLTDFAITKSETLDKFEASIIHDRIKVLIGEQANG